MPALIAHPNTITLPEAWYRQLTDLRVSNPERVVELAAQRKRLKPLAPDGRLSIMACDHPARRVNRIGSNPVGMANRWDYLSRMVTLLRHNKVDGVMATADILEELLLLQDLAEEPFLDGKVLIASLNRGGLSGVAWEMDDPVTGATPASCAALNLDGAKLLLRIEDGNLSSLKTLQACAEAINQLNVLRLPCFLEPLPVRKTETGYQVIREAQALAEIVGVASALGDSSRYLWLKLPYCEGFAQVARATTLPILLLGGEANGQPESCLVEIRQAMQAAHNVRGVMLGRNLLYPGEDDLLAFAASVYGVVHQADS